MVGNNEGMIIQDRDRRLLTLLAVLRVVDREQAKRVAGFGSTTRANARLLMLTRAGLLRRFFVGNEGGARRALYALAPKGAQFAQVPLRGPRRSSDRTLFADFFVMHQLRINEIYCIAKHEPIPVEGAAFVSWRSFENPPEGTSLIPDGYLEIAQGSNVIALFLEVDLGTESRSVWRGKVQAYLQFAASGTFEEQFHERRFRTLVVAESDRRMESLRTATAELTDKIFWFTTFELISRDGFWSAIWTRPTDVRRQSLLSLS